MSRCVAAAICGGKIMKYLWMLFGLFAGTVLPLCAQNWTLQDSLRLQELLENEGEIELNREALKVLQIQPQWGKPQTDEVKPWLEFDPTLPEPVIEEKPRVRLTLRPYTTNTRYDWDPVYQKKITVTKDTWRGNSFSPFTRNVVRSAAQTGVNKPSGHDFLAPFTRDFWDFRGRKNRARTLQVLRFYGKTSP